MVNPCVVQFNVKLVLNIGSLCQYESWKKLINVGGGTKVIFWNGHLCFLLEPAEDGVGVASPESVPLSTFHPLITSFKSTSVEARCGKVRQSSTPLKEM